METSDCVVAGGGPAGAMAAYLLARAGLRVTLLEGRGDFNRRFRGDTIAPPVLDYLDTLGLAQPLLSRIPHARAGTVWWHTPDRDWPLSDFRAASARFPYYALIPQVLFLSALTEQATKFPGFDLRMNARVSRLLTDSGRVTGVEYSHQGQPRRVHAPVVIGADGRNSKVRALAGIQARELGASLDIAWFSVPRDAAADPALSGLDLFSQPGALLALLNQIDNWQIGYTIPAGTFPRLRGTGVGPVRRAITGIAPWLGDRVDALTDVNQLTLLPVRITAVDTWHKPGLLLIGDAAHAISPVGGNGINLAIADAAEAANQLVTARSPAQVDAVCQAVEARRRPLIDRIQAGQVRTEQASLRRLRTGQTAPPFPLQVISRIPAARRWAGRRSASEIAIPAARPEILCAQATARS